MFLLKVEETQMQKEQQKKNRSKTNPVIRMEWNQKKLEYTLIILIWENVDDW